MFLTPQGMKIQNFLIEHSVSSYYTKCSLRWTPVRYGTILNWAKRPRIWGEKSLLLFCVGDRFFFGRVSVTDFPRHRSARADADLHPTQAPHLRCTR